MRPGRPSRHRRGRRPARPLPPHRTRGRRLWNAALWGGVLLAACLHAPAQLSGAAAGAGVEAPSADEAAIVCTTSSQCMLSAFVRPVSGPDDCYCPVCPTPMNAGAAREHELAWRRHGCAARQCLQPGCIDPPVPVCIDERCTGAR